MQIDSNGASDNLLEQEAILQSELQQALHYEEEYWREKSRVKWHCQGDRNTSYFHRLTKIRYASKAMSMLKVGDSIIDSPNDIVQHVLNFYSNLYVVPNNCQSNDLISRVVPNLVSQEDNRILTMMPSKDEIKKAVFDMNGEGAPGPEGFGGCFYQTYWDI